jgi:hypothetical protein
MNILNNWKMLELSTRDGESLVCIEGRVYGSNPRFPYFVTHPDLTGHRLQPEVQLDGDHDQTGLGVSPGQTGSHSSSLRAAASDAGRLSSLNQTSSVPVSTNWQPRLTGFEESHPRSTHETVKDG